ncbi:MAG: aspartate kinase [Caldisericia bacterium]|nr:aspartate kinase [Caldisericia bacterium]MDD4615221.1 aspartate kinase [Caldisericia bacterium]
MKLVVQKYGGSSLKDRYSLEKVLCKIHTTKKDFEKIVVVVSAMGKTTNDLLDMVRSYTTKKHPRELDMLLTTGEQVSASILSMVLQEHGFASVSLNAYQAGITTNKIWGEANIQKINTKRIRSKLRNYDVIVITGFQGITDQNEMTTLGRGGSDTTAVALAASLSCPCHIFSDVDGVYSVDPKLYPDAMKLPYISYEEMLEMSRQGSGILHDRSIEIAQKFEIPIYCASTFSEKEGSMIFRTIETTHTKPVIGISVLSKQWLITTNTKGTDPTFLKTITTVLQKYSLNIDMIALSNHTENWSLSMTVWEDDYETAQDTLEKAQKVLTSMSQSVIVQGNLSKITLVGSNMRKTVGVTDMIFEVIPPNDIYMITTSEVSISLLVSSDKANKTIAKLARRFSL